MTCYGGNGISLAVIKGGLITLCKVLFHTAIFKRIDVTKVSSVLYWVHIFLKKG